MPRKKQRRAWGSITEVQRGKKYVLRWQESTPQGYRRKTRTVRGTYREACAALDVIHAGVMERGGDARRMTFGAVARKWWMPELEERVASGAIKPSTAERYMAMWESYVEPRWARVPCDQIRQSDIQDWIGTMTRSMAECSMSVAKAIMDMAVLREEADGNRFRASYRMPGRGERRTKDVLTLEEARELFDSVRGSMLEPAVILSLFGGCRVSESLAVAVDDVRFEERAGALFAVVSVRRQMSGTGSAPRAVGDMKNAQSERVTVVPPPYSDRLREICARRKADGSQWVADKGDGTPPCSKVVSNMWKKKWGEYGVEGKWVTLQNMRPSWRTFAAGRWKVSGQTLELMMGHKLPGVSGKHYIRPDERMVIDNFEDDYLAKNGNT